METLTTLPYQPSDAVEFLDYMQHVITETGRLRDEGRVPDEEGVDALLTLWRKVTSQIRLDLNKVGPAARQPIISVIPMTQAEYEQSWTMFETLYPLLQILEMRGAVNIRATEPTTRVVTSVFQGAHSVAARPVG
jgi:hypothetical protein